MYKTNKTRLNFVLNCFTVIRAIIYHMKLIIKNIVYHILRLCFNSLRIKGRLVYQSPASKFCEMPISFNTLILIHFFTELRILFTKEMAS